MRIAFSNASPKWGGVHVVTEMLANGLSDRNHQILLLCRPDSTLYERLHHRFDTAPIVRGLDFNPVRIARIAARLRTFKPDVLVTFMEKDVRLSLPAARSLGIPTVVRRANDQPIADTAANRFLYTSAAAHVANSEATKRTLLQSADWLDAARIHVIYNAIDARGVDDVDPAILDLPRDAAIVAFAGRLEERKGVHELLAAWHIVQQRHPNAWLVIAGKGPLEDVVRATATDAAHIRFLGFRRDVIAVFKASDVVAVPSHWEGFGLVALEALAASRAVVAADASSLPEIIRDGSEGMLVPPRNPEALADALIRLLGDAGLRERLGAAGRARAASVFGVDRMIDAYERLLSSVAQ